MFRNWNLDLNYLNFSGNQRLEIKNDFKSVSNASAIRSPMVNKKNLGEFEDLLNLQVLGLVDVDRKSVV